MNISRREFLMAASATGIVIPAFASVEGIQIGVCAPTQELDEAVRYGFDYLEPGAASVSEMDEARFQTFKKKLMASPIRCECYNSFIRRHDLRVVGDDVHWDTMRVYLDHTLARCRQLGGSIVVWDSAGSRNVPPGYSREKAWSQIKDFLRRAGRTSDLSPEETIRRTMSLLSEKGRFERLLRVAASEPPRVRAIIGAIGEQLGKNGPALRRLRRSLNPFSRLDLGLLAGLRHARTWQAKERP